MGRIRQFSRGVGMVGAGVGFVTLGAAAGFAAEKLAVGRMRLKRDPEVDEPFGSLRGRPVEVLADDGTRLHVEVDGSDDEPITVVFSHGYALNSDSFHYQRRDLPDVGRLVFWDQRSHGRSGRGHRDYATIDQLGRDLYAVLNAVAPTGPLVLVGHSMGGMTVMALADQHPELFGDRVVGVAIISSSAGELHEITLGVRFAPRLLLRRSLPTVVAAVGRQHELVERGRRAGGDVAFLVVRRYSFGSDVPPSLIEFASEMIAATPLDVVAEFFPTLHSHDKLHALVPFNNGVEVLILVGDKDLLIPPEHSMEIARAVPAAEFVIVPNAGHMVILEHHAEVNGHLRDLIEQARRSAYAGRRPARRAGRLTGRLADWVEDRTRRTASA